MEELEGRDHALEDGFGALEGQRQDEGSVGVGPGRHEEGNLATPLGEIDLDVTEIGLEPPAREMPQRDEGLLMPASMFEQIALHLGISAAVSLFVAETSEDLGGGMALFGRGGLVVAEDLVDERLDRSQPRSEPIPGGRQGIGLGLLEDLADSVARMVEFAGDLTDGFAIAPRSPNGTVIVHRKHVLNPP